MYIHIHIHILVFVHTSYTSLHAHTHIYIYISYIYICIINNYIYICIYIHIQYMNCIWTNELSNSNSGSNSGNNQSAFARRGVGCQLFKGFERELNPAPSLAEDFGMWCFILLQFMDDWGNWQWWFVSLWFLKGWRIEKHLRVSTAKTRPNWGYKQCRNIIQSG